MDVDEMKMLREKFRYSRDPGTARIIIQNDRGEIVGLEITGFLTGSFMLFHGPNALDPHFEPYTGSSWRVPSEASKGQPEQGSEKQNLGEGSS